MNKLQEADERIGKYFTGIFQLARMLNPRAYVTSVTRTRSEQNKLYSDYLAGRSRFPAAPPALRNMNAASRWTSGASSLPSSGISGPSGSVGADGGAVTSAIRSISSPRLARKLHV